jgi:hypothetical protein
MSLKRFTALMQKAIQGSGLTYIDIPFDAQKKFIKKGRIPVKGSIDGISFRSSLLPHRNGNHYLIINMTIRNKIGKEHGDTVKVELQHDTEVRIVELPKPFVKALKYNPDAKKVFEKYPYSHKKEIIDWIMDAKKEETKLKRIEKAIIVLSQKK